MSEITRLHQVAQHADDLERATTFYRDVLGLRHVASYVPPGLVFFDLGGCRLLIEQAASSSLLYLEVPDLTSARARLESLGVRFDDEPHLIFHDADGTFGEPGVGEWMTFFHDSEGNQLALVERRRTDP